MENFMNVNFRKIQIFITKYIVLIVIIYINGSGFLYANNVLESQVTIDNNIKKDKKNLIWFKFVNEPFIDLINYVATKKKFNIIIPQNDQGLQAKITFSFNEKISIDDAWKYVISLLEIAGYTIVYNNEFVTITKTTATVWKEIFPLFINTPINEIPLSDDKIRYIRYFKNIQVAAIDGAAGSNSFQHILKDFLSKDASCIIEPIMNAVIITDRSRCIRGSMEIFDFLDVANFTESITSVPLQFTSADIVADLFKNLMMPQVKNSVRTFSVDARFFSSNVKIIAEPRTNKLILIGEYDALQRIKSFVLNYIDIPIESGSSLLNIYELQYLKASDFVSTLQSIVTGQGVGGQSTSTGKSSSEQFFKGVIITTESAGSGGSVSGNSPQTIGNKLIIAAQREDWTRIKRLIQELDKPNLQVAMEVLIVDLNFKGDNALGTQIRDKMSWGLKNMHFQTSNLNQIQMTGDPNPTAINALQSDLFQLTSGSNIASNSTPGSTILSIKDLDAPAGSGGMWLVLRMLNMYSNTKIISQPFIVTSNNKLATFNDSETRYLAGGATVQQAATTITKDQVTANLTVSITPLISCTENINMQITINIGEFSGDTSNSKINRTITTNANVQNGDVLVLGGLTKAKSGDTTYETPIISKIPGFGWLGKNKSKSVGKESLMVFICPRIIRPMLNVIDDYTISKLDAAGKMVSEYDHGGRVRDPITRWFFGTRSDDGISKESIDVFTQKKIKSVNIKNVSIPYGEKQQLREDFEKMNQGESASRIINS